MMDGRMILLRALRHVSALAGLSALLVVLRLLPATAQGPDLSGFASDDFNTCSLVQGPAAWVFTDPLNDSTHRIVGTGTGNAWLEIAVPAGVKHDPWNSSYNVPRAMQSIANTDFEIEVKFLSNVTLGNQMQGVLIEQDAGNYVRFDFHSLGSGLRIFAASTTSGISTSRSNKAIASGVPQYMRIKRVGNQWTQTYSFNGSTWTTAASFSHALTAVGAGLFAGNAGANPPAHTAQFDYAFSTASPIVGEDGAPAAQYFTLTTSATGSGTVARNPNQPTYACGTPVTLTATPNAGWAFSGWTGDLTGSLNPATFTMDSSGTVTALFTEVAPATPPVITNVQVAPTHNSTAITWVTNKPATSSVAYGLSQAYENGSVNSSALVTAHSVLLTGLSATTLYHFKVTSAAQGQSSSSGDLTFQTAADPSGFVSDDFNVCSLDEGVGGWTFADPLGGSTRRIVGTGTGNAWLEIAVLGGVAHDAWNASNNAPRVMQAIANSDFEIEVKFLSNVVLANQMQGVFIEQNASNYVRFDFHSKGSGLRVFAATTTNGVSTSRSNKAIASGVPQYMRIKRVGNQWTQKYSFNGSTWTTAASFSHPLTATRAGLFAGNAGATPPAHTAQFDYAFNTGSPILQEDSAPAGQMFTLATDVTGSGVVQRDPDQSSYACGAPVALTAVPASGWVFSAWTGDVLSNLNPITISATEDKSVTAHFVLNVPPVISNISIVPGDTWTTVSWRTDELATTQVDYGLTPAHELGTRTNPGFRTQHTIVVTGLSPQTTYNLALVSADVHDASSASPNQTVTTTAVFPLTISNIQVAAQEFSATVSWVTNKPATSVVRYGTTAAYELGAVSGTTLTQSHAITINGLSQGTTYHYRIAVSDEAGFDTQSVDKTFTTPQDSPVIAVWHGEDQRFGHLGIPQTWVNILGNVQDPDGVRTLHFSLNGGPLRRLSIGPDSRRLAAAGDFNVEMTYAEVNQGFNDVRIVASDTVGNVSERTVRAEVTKNVVWNLPYNINWGSVANIQDVAQVVDGAWEVQAQTVRSVAPSYDRLVAIGDVSWTNYEVTTSVTVHSVDPAGYLSPSNGPAVGLGVRWKGHSVWDSSQPSIGYWPLGALAWYRWKTDGTEQFQLLGNRLNKKHLDTTGRRLVVGSKYMFKVRVQTEPDGQHRYQFKTWLASGPEPAGWHLQILNGNLADDPPHGSLLLLAHHVNASFGAVTVVPIP
jgi:hypothetical protein